MPDSCRSVHNGVNLARVTRRASAALIARSSHWTSVLHCQVSLVVACPAPDISPTSMQNLMSQLALRSRSMIQDDQGGRTIGVFPARKRDAKHRFLGRFYFCTPIGSIR